VSTEAVPRPLVSVKEEESIAMLQKRSFVVLFLALGAILVASGCGSSSSSSSSTPSATTPAASSSGGGAAQVVEIDVAASGLAYTKTSATAKAGTVTLRSMNPQSIEHDISIQNDDGSINESGDLVSGGGVSEVTVDLTPGTYTFYCSVPGHKEAGMSGTLTVS
jgi:uncharacterized cupredoxin-like copper-binding protein